MRNRIFIGILTAGLVLCAVVDRRLLVLKAGDEATSRRVENPTPVPAPARTTMRKIRVDTDEPAALSWLSQTTSVPDEVKTRLRNHN
jgi:hypothetical protein